MLTGQAAGGPAPGNEGRGTALTDGESRGRLRHLTVSSPSLPPAGARKRKGPEKTERPHPRKPGGTR